MIGDLHICKLANVVITPEMRAAAEHEVMLRLCGELGAHSNWDWIVEDVISAMMRSEAELSDQKPRHGEN